MSQVPGEYFHVFFQVSFIFIVEKDAENLKELKTVGSMEGPGTCGLRTVSGDNHAGI